MQVSGFIERCGLRGGGLLGVLKWSGVQRRERPVECKWRSVVRCCAADVFGKLREPAALLCYELVCACACV